MASPILPRARQTESPSRQITTQDGTGFPFHQSSASLPSTPKVTSFTTAATGSRPSPKQGSSMFGGHMTSDQLRTHHAQDHAEFAHKREALVTALDSTTLLVKSLAAFNQDKWTIHYPHQLGVATAPAATAPSGLQRGASSPNTPVKSGAGGLRRTSSMLGMAHDETATKDDSPTRPAIPQRAYSTAETPARSSTPVVAAEAGPAHPLSILSLDLKMGHSAAVSSSSSHSALLPSLSLQTLAHLLARRLASSLTHLSALKTRVSDTQSRILITGDLNAGKSTLVNALLRRKIMPVDQQPCTSVFAEVVDAKTWNNSVEEVHAIPDVAMYDPKDEATFERFDLGEVERLMDEGHGDDSDDDVETETQEKKTPAAAKYQMLKAYVMDSRAPVVEATEEEDDPAANPSFIRNSLVSISLIDAPGLNRDTLSTTALFARQSEIDVIVFVVSAENHFTLSAKEFLWNAAREKAYVFIVVNKWQGIRDKKRCMRVVGEQIRQLSPKTWDARDELVHFVDAADVFDDDGEPIPDTAAASEGEFDAVPPSFAELESALRTFVLLKRTTSKLAPARTYLLNLLADLSTLSATNVSAATAQLDRATAKLDDVRPVNDRLKRQRDEVEHGVDAVEEGTVEAVQRSAWSRLEQALAHVANGEVVPASASDEGSTPAYEDSLARPTELPVYPGLLGLWEWAADVKRTLVQALEVEVRAAEDDARKATSEGVKTVMDGLGNKYLPAAVAGQEDKNEAQVGPQRVFRPEVMFAKRRRGVGRLAARGVSAGLGLGVPTLGAANAWSVTDFDVSFFDLFDLDRLVSHGNLLRSGGKRSSKKKMISNGGDDDLLESSAIWGLGLGSVGMLGSRVIGVKGTMDSLTRVLELLGSDKARKWAGPVLGVITAGLVAYIIVDLPRAVPRNIGRKLESALAASSTQLQLESSSSTNGALAPPTSFSTAHAERIARETRKVLRLAGWDLRERFRAALDRSEAERKEVEGQVAKCEAALKWLAEFEGQVEAEEKRVVEVVV